NNIGDVALGAVTSHHYSAAHDSPENKAFVEAFKKAHNGMRPNFMAVGGYDGMHLIYEGLKKTNGAGGQALIDAMKGMSWTSPRGPVSIDPQTRDIVQTVYIRKVERKDGELYNVEFATIPNVKDPVKAAKSNRACRRPRAPSHDGAFILCIQAGQYHLEQPLETPALASSIVASVSCLYTTCFEGENR
ncbi:MAG: ABC transporter substrate-binding protein, partial [Microvirga sp.]